MTKESHHSGRKESKEAEREKDQAPPVSSRVLDRRNLLKSLATAGAAATIFPGDIVQAKNSDRVEYISHFRHSNHEEVKKGAPPEKEPEYNTMPRLEWIKMTAARKATKSLFDIIRKGIATDDLRGISVSTKTTGNDFTKELIVNYNKVKSPSSETVSQPGLDYEEVRDVVPDTVSAEVTDPHDSSKSQMVSDIPVRNRRQTIYEQDCHENHFDSDYEDKIPGGCKAMSGSGGINTLATPCYDYDSDERSMLGSGHVYESELYSYQPDSESDKDGLVHGVYTDGKQDYAELSPKNGASYPYKLANDDGGYLGSVVGTVSWTEIQNMESNSGIMEKQGRSTGYSEGEVYETETDSNGVRAFWTKGDALGGDSGGPHYTSEVDLHTGEIDIYIAGIHAWSWDDNCPRTHAGAPYIGDAESDLNVGV